MNIPRKKTLVPSFLSVFSVFSGNGTKEPAQNTFGLHLTGRGVAALLAAILLCSFLFVGGACSRQHYRIKADKEAYELLSCASRDPRWKLDDYRINVDPRSRMYDVYNPDCEPMPPDDPSSHKKMHCVAGMKGSKHWHDCGCTMCIENPRWKEFLLFNERGAVSLDKDGAFELALRHSPEYQSAMENLYLSALKVSQERFRFDVQFFGGDSLFYTASGRLRSTDGTKLTNDADIRATKLFATGGELAVGLANSITWTFAGPDDWKAHSLFNVSLVQPLLRNAGRKVVLENLTQSERTFLAALRQMVYFQQGYYTKVVTGSGAVSAPSGSSRANTPNSSDGLYGLLAEQIRIQNRRQNIVRLEDNLQRLEEYFKAGQVDDRSQVEETRQSLLSSESTILRQNTTYATNVDNYLRSLGLPPDLNVEVSDVLMERFQLTSPSLTSLQADLHDMLSILRQKDSVIPEDFKGRLLEIVRRTESEVKSLDNDLEILQKSVPTRKEGLQSLRTQLDKQMQQGERVDPAIYDTDIFHARVEHLKNVDIPKNIRRIEAIFTLFEVFIEHDEPTLREILQSGIHSDDFLDALIILRLVDIPEVELEAELVAGLQDSERSARTLKLIRDRIRAKKQALTLHLSSLPDSVPIQETDSLAPTPLSEVSREQVSEERLARRKVVAELQSKDIYRDWIRRLLSVFQYELVNLSIMQTRTRLDSITLVPTLITPEDAFQIASEHRLDWMNQRASLVDSWRQIDISANKLKSNLNVKVEGEIGTVDKRGVRFDADDGRLRVGVEWDSPLTRHNEMLDYRRAQVAYQASRRDYYTYVDAVNADLRRILRNIQINQVEFEITRNAILVATLRVDLMQLNMDKPPKRGGDRLETNTASRLIDALNGLMTSQNDFLATWVAYQTQRMLLDMNMGTMELDGQGRWVDPGTITKDRVATLARSQGAYAGAFATESRLVPSQRKRTLGHHGKQFSSNAFTEVEYSIEMDPDAIPDAPRLEGERPILAPSLMESDFDSVFEQIATDQELPTEEEQVEEAGEEQEPTSPPSILPRRVETNPKASQNVVPRSVMSPDTIPDPGLRTPRTLKFNDAPPPPKTPE